MPRLLSAVILSLTLLVSLQPALADSSEFSDISEDKHRDSIEFLKEQGIISGYPDGTFKPGRVLNRAELLKILVAGQDIDPDPTIYKDCFPDVYDEWFAPYVCYAHEQKWVSGYTDGYFRPERAVNKAESIKMLINTQGIALADSDAADFADIDSTDWFAPYVATAKKKGLLEETGNFQPSTAMTRGGISENIFRAIAVKQTGSEKYTAEIREQVLQLSESVSQNTTALTEMEQRIQDLENQLATSEQSTPSTTTNPTEEATDSTATTEPITTNSTEATTSTTTETQTEPTTTNSTETPTISTTTETQTETTTTPISQSGILTISDESGGTGYGTATNIPDSEISAGEQRVHLSTLYFRADYGDVTVMEIPLTLNADFDWINAGFYLEVDGQEIRKVIVNYGYSQKITTDGIPSGKVWDSSTQTYIDHGDTAFADEAGLFTITAGESKKVSLYFDNNVEYVECGLDFLPTFKPSMVQSTASGLGNSETFWFDFGTITVKFSQDDDEECSTYGRWYNTY